MTFTESKSTHFAAMIYYRKILFGSGPKLTIVQLFSQFLKSQY